MPKITVFKSYFVYFLVLLVCSEAFSQELSEKVSGSFACLRNSELNEKPTNLKDILSIIRKVTPLDVDDTHINFHSGNVFSEEPWDIQVNHGGIVTATRATQIVLDLDCIDRKTTNPNLACNPEFSKFNQLEPLRIDDTVVWETLVFNEVGQTVVTSSTSSWKKEISREYYSCIDE